MNKEEKERILKCVLIQIEKERTPRSHRYWKRTAVVVAAAVMLLACCAFTAKVLRLDTKLEALIGGTNEQIVRSVTNLNASVESKGIRVEAKQAVGDGQRVFVLVEVTSLTAQKLDASCGFDEVEVIQNGVGSWSSSFGVMEGENISENGKQLNFLLQMTTEEPAGKQKVSLYLKNLTRLLNMGNDSEKTQERRLITGTWNLDFTLEYKDISQRYRMDKVMKTGKGAVRIDEVSISPVSCFIRASVVKCCRVLESEWNKLADVSLKLKDGSAIPVWIDGTSWLEDGKNSSGTMEGVLGELINMDEVKAIVIGGEELSL